MSDEKAALYASRVLNYVANLKACIARKELMDNVEEFHVYDTAYNTGTVYLPDGTTKQGKRVGLFNVTDGCGSAYESFPRDCYYKEFPFSTDTDQNAVFTIVKRPVRVNGAEVGTTANDVQILVERLDVNVCKSINKSLYGIDTLPTAAGSAATGAFVCTLRRYSGSTSAYNITSGVGSVNYSQDEGCVIRSYSHGQGGEYYTSLRTN